MKIIIATMLLVLALCPGCVMLPLVAGSAVSSAIAYFTERKVEKAMDMVEQRIQERRTGDPNHEAQIIEGVSVDEIIDNIGDEP